MKLTMELTNARQRIKLGKLKSL
ncbi:unnamed protein product [Timema podura]|uniref:Uncharacterized protein n=1 Tax=Timema podura TaxID=61482 RepID=A0ABN7PHI1_TIMPD|nr:unnamed protein product [Timema podura]